FSSSDFSNSSTAANVCADSPTLPFHWSNLGYSRCNGAKSSCHLLTSANKCVRSHLSDSAMSARVGVSMAHSRIKLTQHAKTPRLPELTAVPPVRDVQWQDGARQVRAHARLVLSQVEFCATVTRRRAA